MDYLYPVLYALIILMGITVACLLTAGRKKEMALMRGMGAKKGRILLTFLSEQFLLCLFGCLFGFVFWYVTGNGFAWRHLLLGAVFLAGYTAGSLFWVLRINHVKLSVLFADKEEQTVFSVREKSMRWWESRAAERVRCFPCWQDWTSRNQGKCFIKDSLRPGWT